MKIGIFDSGWGGRFTLEKLKKLLPEYQYETYFDHKNAPYGDKHPEEILKLTEEGCRELWNKGCRLILIACNTASSQSLRALQERYPNKKILGCLIPAVEEAIDQGGKNIGLIATAHTIRTKKYNREAFKINPKVKIFGAATPKLVPWLENIKTFSFDNKESNWLPPEIKTYIEQKIDSLIKKHQIDTLILGCTHYSILKTYCQRTYPHLNIIDSAEAQALRLKNYLSNHPELL